MSVRNLSKEKNVFKSLFIFSLPLIVANILTQSYNLVDLIVAGRVIGSDALSATGCTSTLIQFLSSLFWGFGIALSTVVGEYFGRGDKGRIIKTLKTAILFIIGVMLVLTVSCFLFAPQILTLLKVDPDIFDSACSYFRIYMVALFIQAVTYQMSCVFHGVGNSKYPMVMTAVSGLGNVCLNLVFVLVFKMGVNGLAYATIVSNTISFIIGGCLLIKIIKELDGDFKLEFDIPCLKHMGVLAIPCIIQQCALYLSSVIVQPVINDMGKSYSAGYSIAMNVNLLINGVYHSLSRATATYTSQSRGAGRHNNYTKGIATGLLIQFLLVTPLGILVMIFPETICSIFLKNNDISALPYAITYTRICIPFLYFICIGNLMHSFYKSVEATKTVVFTTFMFTVARVFFTHVIPDNGLLSSVYWGLALAWVFEAILLMAIYFMGIWRSKEIKEYQQLNKKEKMVG